MNDNEKKLVEDVFQKIREHFKKCNGRMFIEDYDKCIKAIKREYGLLPKYQTLREYITENSNGAYHRFVFFIDGSFRVEVSDVPEFEYYHQPHFLDDYVVVEDKRTNNDGNVENYECIHHLKIERKEVEDKSE